MSRLSTGRRWELEKYPLTVVAFLGLAALLTSWTHEQRYPLLQEGGLVEGATVLGYLVVVAYVATALWSQQRWRSVSLGLIPLYMAMRELDFDKRFVEGSVLRGSFYLGPSSWQTKLMAATAVGILIWACWRAFRDHVVPIVRSGQAAWAWVGGASFLFLLVVSKSLDGAVRKLSDWTGSSRDEIAAALPVLRDAYVFEEILELGLPLVMLLLLVDYRRRKSPSTNSE